MAPAKGGDADIAELVEHLTPCSPGDADAIELTWADVDSEKLVEPELVMSDFLRAIQAVRPSVAHADIARHIAFTDESGVD